MNRRALIFEHQGVAETCDVTSSDGCYSGSMRDGAESQCPNCGAEYLVWRHEAAPKNDKELLCSSCGGPLRNREGRFALQYFRRDGGRAHHRNGRQPKFR